MKPGQQPKKQKKLPKHFGVIKRVHQDEYYDLDEAQLVDYSDIFPTFNHIFTAFYVKSSLYRKKFDPIETMKDIHLLFNFHVKTVDSSCLF